MNSRTHNSGPFVLRKTMSIAVLLEDNHCLAVLKPAGMLTIGDQTGDESLHGLACRYIQSKYHKPGRVFLGVVHRLDRPVSGVLLFARTSKSAARLSAQFRDRTVRKTYQALVEGRVAEGEGALTSWLIKDDRTNTVRECDPSEPGAQRSSLSFRRLDVWRNQTLLEIHLETGRSHQIRVQLAGLGHPVVGDVRYGSHSKLGRFLCLHASSLQFLHPVTRSEVTIAAPAPLADWRSA